MILDTQQIRQGNMTTVEVQSDLSGPPGQIIYYHWYLGGRYAGMTTIGRRSFLLEAGRQAVVHVVDTNDPDFDPPDEDPTEVHSDRDLFWIASPDPSVAKYRIEQKTGAGAWTTIATLFDTGGWSYTHRTGALEDLQDVQWRIVPVDSTGNDGTPLVIGPEKIVRTPDAPNFTVTFDEETGKVTVSEIET